MYSFLLIFTLFSVLWCRELKIYQVERRMVIGGINCAIKLILCFLEAPLYHKNRDFFIRNLIAADVKLKKSTTVTFRFGI